MGAPAPAGVLRALAEVSEIVLELGHTMRRESGFQPVHSPTTLRAAGSDGFTMEWYADLVLVEGRSLSYGLQLASSRGGWTVTGRVLADDADRNDDLLIEYPEFRTADVGPAVARLTAYVREMAADHVAVVRQFMAGYS